MRLTRIDVENLPGLPRGFSLTPGPGVNLIIGPNTSGKSSVARAVRSLLWPQTVPGARRLRLSARFERDGRTLRAGRDIDGTMTWSSDGQPTAPPRLPPPHLRGLYELGLLDLTDRGLSSGEFAAEIRRQMTGGFDLELDANELFGAKPGPRRTRLDAWNDAEQKCGELARRHRSLHEHEHGLASLRRQLAEAEELRREAEALVAALAVHTAREALRAAESLLAPFPAGMARFRPEDPQALTKARQRRLDAEVEVAACEQQILETRTSLMTLGLPDAAGAAELAAVEPLVEAWRRADSERDTAAAALAAATARLEEAGRELVHGTADPGVAPGRVAIERLARLFVESTDAQARQQATGMLLDDPVLAPAANGMAASGPALVAARTAVESWLAQSTMPVAWPLATALAGSALVVALSRAAAGAIPLALAVIVAGGGAVLAVRALVARQEVRRLEAAARKVLRETGLSEALTDRAAATALCERLRHEVTRRALVADWRDRLERIAGDAAADTDRAQSEASALAAACGIGTELSGVGILHDAAATARWREANEALSAAQAQAARRTADADLYRGQACAALSAAGIAEVSDGASAQGTLSRWRERLAERTRLQESLKQLIAQRDSAGRRQIEAAGELGQIRERLFLAADGAQDDGPAVLAAQHHAWEQVSSQVTEARSALAVRLEACDPALAAVPREELVARLEGAQAAPGREDELRQQIADLNADLKQAREGRDFEEALAVRDRCLEALIEDRAAARRAALAEAMLADLRAQTADTRPVVLARAAELLAEFTHDRHQLEVLDSPDREPVLAATDAFSERQQALDELSDGTRAQLMLAVRLAFIEWFEQGDPLPLFLDEALTTTDEERFRAIAGAMGELSRSRRRQVFYLTSQAHDIGAWQQALAARELPEPQVLDLATARALATAAKPGQMAPPTAAVVPRPGPGPEGLAAWCQAVNVPAFDPRLPVAAQHVYWLLLDDADLLYGLGVARAAQVGVALARRADLIDGGVLDHASAAALKVRGEMLESFCGHWWVGRGRPVTVEDIDGIDGRTLSDKMRGPVLAVLDKVGGDPVALAAVLSAKKAADRVPHLRTATAEEIVDHLREIGAIDDREILDEATVLQRVLGDLGRSAAAGGGSSPDPAVVRDCVSRWWRAAEAATAPPPAGSD